MGLLGKGLLGLLLPLVSAPFLVPLTSANTIGTKNLKTKKINGWNTSLSPTQKIRQPK